MGKKKRSSQHHNLDLPSSWEDMPCSSRTALLSREVPCSSRTALLSRERSSSGMNDGDGSAKLLKSNSSVSHHHYNLGRSIFLKRSRNHYSRRNSGSLSNPSTSRGLISPLHDERLSFKFAQYKPDGRDKAFGFGKPERIRCSSLVMDPVSPDKVNAICGGCQKHLKRKPYFLGNMPASGEFSVVAVLVCGHVYHADCLEVRTSFEDRRDPRCPLCSGSPSQI